MELTLIIVFQNSSGFLENDGYVLMSRLLRTDCFEERMLRVHMRTGCVCVDQWTKEACWKKVVVQASGWQIANGVTLLSEPRRPTIKEKKKSYRGVDSQISIEWQCGSLKGSFARPFHINSRR